MGRVGGELPDYCPQIKQSLSEKWGYVNNWWIVCHSLLQGKNSPAPPDIPKDACCSFSQMTWNVCSIACFFLASAVSK
eukprot:14034632-Ditylum_brightwellii.AAC.1